jgi:hypothetical protein
MRVDLMHLLQRFALIVVGCLAFTGVRAQELLPPETEVASAVDHYITEKLQSRSIEPGPAADDATVLRRTMLDLAGRVPTAREHQWFFDQPETVRRDVLVDRLMQSSDFDFHLRNSLDELLLANRPHDGEFREYLLWAVRQKRPWDQMFRDMLAARQADGVEKGAAQFVSSRVRNLDDLTNDTAMLFFGVNVSCAKCHDHPLVEAWKQDHFYGMQAFFQRTFITRKNVIAEKPFGEVKFKTTKGEEKSATLMFLNGSVAEDKTPSFADDERKQLEQQIQKLERDEKAGYVISASFSPRRELSELAIRDDKERFLAKNIVNRTWLRLMGLGLVDPPDQLHEANPASHPQLLDWLTRDFVASGYDLRRLIRGITLSQAYARSSEWAVDETPPAASTYAFASTKSLTPRQMAASLLVVIRSPDNWPAPEDSVAWNKLRNDLENQAGGWSREFEQPGENFQIAVDEALFFSNNDRITNDLLRDGGDRIVGKLKSIEENSQAVEQLWVTVLNRKPSDQELQTATAWMQRENTDRVESLRSLTWALLAGPELRFNH